MKATMNTGLIRITSSGFALLIVVNIMAFFCTADAQKHSDITADSTLNNVEISGEVSDGREPIAGARVQIQGETELVTADNQGRFILEQPDYPDDRVPVTAGVKNYYNNRLYTRKISSDVEIILNSIEISDDPEYEFIAPMPNANQQRMGRMLQTMGGGMHGGSDPGMGMGMMGRGRGMMTMMGSSGAMACGNCHDNYYKQWEKSTMAVSSANQWVLDYYNGTGAKGARAVAPGFKLDYPDSPGKCADCHAPEIAINRPGRIDLNDAYATSNNALRGVTCDFCHKIRQVEMSNGAGVEKIELNRMQPAGGMMMQPVFVFGPYVDVITTPMAASYLPLEETAEFCSACHQSAWPLPDGERWDYTKIYANAGKYDFYENGKAIPNYWTYQEWLEWQDGLASDDPDKGRKCQDCHMNWTREMLPYDKYIVSGAAKAQLGIERDPSRIHPHEFQGVTESRLKGAVYLSLDASYQGNELVANVEVINVNTGHWLPTGSPMRNMILVITATDSKGNLLTQTGGPEVPGWGGSGNYADGYYAGMPGKGYAKVTRDVRGNLNVPIWQATAIVSDNRIKQKQADDVTVKFKKPEGAGAVDIKAQLIYRKTFKAIADVKGWKLQDIVMRESSLTL